MKLDSMKGPAAVVLTALAVLVAVSALAGEARAPLVLEGYENPSRPPRISTGPYEEIIAASTRHLAQRGRNPAPVATNLCVAYIKTGRLVEARSACDAALAAARAGRSASPPTWSYWTGDGTLAVARSYSNRAVLNWVSGDHAAARADLDRAAAHAPRAHFVVSNAAAFAERGSTLATMAGGT